MVGLALALLVGPTLRADMDGWESTSTPVAPFKLKDLDGRVLESSALRGRVVVVDFWATWCTPCVQELPELEIYKQKIQGSREVAFLSLNVTDDAEIARAFAKKKGLRPPVYFGDELLGPYQISGFPTKLILDLRGKGPGRVRYRREGMVTLAGLEQQVAATLAQKP
jgi:thiol-disulfide isomerase/thioredoxin